MIKYVYRLIVEQVAKFFHILGHNVKNQTLSSFFFIDRVIWLVVIP